MNWEAAGPAMKVASRIVLNRVRKTRKRNCRRVTGAEARTYSREACGGESGGDSRSVGGMAGIRQHDTSNVILPQPHLRLRAWRRIAHVDCRRRETAGEGFDGSVVLVEIEPQIGAVAAEEVVEEEQGIGDLAGFSLRDSRFDRH